MNCASLFSLFLNSGYDYNVHVRSRTMEKTYLSEYPVFQGQTKRVSFPECRALGPAFKIKCFCKLEQLELTVTKAPECYRDIFNTENLG